MTTETVFEDIESWLEAISQGHLVAIMPPALASEALGEKKSALSKKLKAGDFPRIVIAGTNYISADHVRKILKDKRNRRADVVAILERTARRNTVIFYGDLMSQVGMRWQSPPDRNEIGVLLGQISRQTYEENGILLSSIVHRKGPAPTHPGPGYMGLIESMAEEYDEFNDDQSEDEADMILRHMNAVRDFYKAN